MIRRRCNGMNSVEKRTLFELAQNTTVYDNMKLYRSV